MMNGHGQSDGCIVPGKSSNKPGEPGAEGMEGRQPAKRNVREGDMPRMQGREKGMQQALERIRQAVRRDKDERLTSLYHHVYDVENLREAYYGLKRGAAAGVDGKTWAQYGQELESNLQELSGRLVRGGYHAQPVRRKYIPKADGRQRPLGIPMCRPHCLSLQRPLALGWARPSSPSPVYDKTVILASGVATFGGRVCVAC